MGERAKKLATYEDVLNAPEHRVAELVKGVLHTFPRPAKPHAMAASALGADEARALTNGHCPASGLLRTNRRVRYEHV